MGTNVVALPVRQKYTQSALREFLSLISPLNSLSKTTVSWLFSGTLLVLGIAWWFSPFVLLPTPTEVAHAFSDLWADGLGAQLVTSYTLNLEAIGVSVVLSLALSYLTVLPLFKPLISMSTGLRFLSMAGLEMAFDVAFNSPHTVKVAILTFSISVWFVTSMLDVIKAIPTEQLDLARILLRNRWRVVWEVVVLGQMDKVFDVLRQTAAMGWMMLTLVESLSFSEGGIGTVLQTMQHHNDLSKVMAIQLSILVLGMTQDYLIGFFKNRFCPYAQLTVEK